MILEMPDVNVSLNIQSRSASQDNIHLVVPPTDPPPPPPPNPGLASNHHKRYEIAYELYIQQIIRISTVIKLVIIKGDH